MRVQPGVYATFTGPLPDLARVWAGVLYAGRHAVAGCETAQWLHGLRPDLPESVTVLVPHGSRHHPSRPCGAGASVAVPVRPASSVRLPPQTTLEDTVVELVDEARTERAVIDMVLRACQQRRTSPSRLAAAAATRTRLRWRRLLLDLVADAEEGVASPLERSYVRGVERAHSLPTGLRNHRDGAPGWRR